MKLTPLLLLPLFPMLAFSAPSDDTDLCAAGRRWFEANQMNGRTIDLEGKAWDLYPEVALETQVFPSNNDAGRVKTALLLKGLKDVVVEGRGAKLLVRGSPLAGSGRTTVIDAPLLPIIVEDCENVTLRGFSIDWKTPGTVQGTCVAVDGKSFDVKLEPEEGQGFWSWNDQLYFNGEGWTWPVRRLLGIHAKTGEILKGTGDNLGLGYEVAWTYQLLEDKKTVRITGPQPAKIQPGNGVLFWCSNYDTGMRRSPAIFVSRSRNVTIEDVTLHYAWGMGVIAQDSTDLTLRRVIVEPSGRRKFSLASDGTHFVGCRGKLTIENCRIQNQFDDCVNIHGIYIQVVRRLNDHTLRVRTTHPQHQGVRGYHPGDKMALLDAPYLVKRAELTLRSTVEYNSETTDLTFEEVLPATLQPKTMLETLTAYPDITIRNNVFRWNRARNMLLNGNGTILVEGNTFEAAGSAIMIESSPTWGESGPVRDVTIRNNVFRNCAHTESWGKAVIFATPEFREKAPAGLPPFHGKITVQGNTFENCHAPELLAESFVTIVNEGNQRK